MVEYFFEQINDDTCKTYLFGPKGGHTAIIVDPKLDYVDDYKKLLEERNIKLKYIIDTHTHADHISGGNALKEFTGAEYIMGNKAPAKCLNQSVEEGDEMDFEGIPIIFIYTPGHTKDSMSVILPGRILTGDALFLDDGGAGRDDLPGGSPEDHWSSIEKFNNLTGDLIVYPAHDYRDREPSSLKTQKERNPFMRHKTQEEFVSFINDLHLGPAEWMKDVLAANYNCTTDPKSAWVPVDSPSCEVMGTLQLDPEIASLDVPMESVDTLKNKLNSGKDVLILDVRAPKEFKRGAMKKIDGSVNIPLTAIVNDPMQLKDKIDKEICVLCGSGKRSKIAAQILEHSGYKKVTVLEGGLRKWHGMPPPPSQ